MHGDDREIIPDITVYAGRRHTYASQYLGVATCDDTLMWRATKPQLG
jgi:hypothetical protein